MISVKSKGDFHNTERFLKKNQKIDIDHYLEMYGQKGVEALSAATPSDTGLTARSWYYEINKGLKNTTITWHNSNVSESSFNIAIGIQYGHGTASGVYVQGVDYINPAMRSIFDSLAEELWKEVCEA